MKPQDWIDAGYKRFNQVKHVREYADFGLQKRFDDEIGKKYFITVYVYDNSQHKARGYDMQDYSFSPDIQFVLGDGKPTINLEIGMDKITTIVEVEQMVEQFWLMLGSVYYEKY